ncbi:hypothetical protein IW138_005318 [Coemansia sp. RSA 986]|nr:hypothetical protein IW138_005318 [Coemansia sp. RSA 986]
MANFRLKLDANSTYEGLALQIQKGIPHLASTSFTLNGIELNSRMLLRKQGVAHRSVLNFGGNNKLTVLFKSSAKVRHGRVDFMHLQ